MPKSYVTQTVFRSKLQIAREFLRVLFGSFLVASDACAAAGSGCLARSKADKMNRKRLNTSSMPSTSKIVRIQVNSAENEEIIESWLNESDESSANEMTTYNRIALWIPRTNIVMMKRLLLVIWILHLLKTTFRYHILPGELTAMLAAAFKSNDEDINALFATDGTGRDIFRGVMSKERFAMILISLRFDDASTRAQRKESDVAAPISHMFYEFIANCQKYCKIGENATIDEMIMDPVIDSDWLGIKQEPNDETQNIGNIARSWQWRERGLDPLNYPSNKSVIENVAEDVLVKKCLNIRCCDLPGYPRSTFLMVFSPDGTKVASTHGNHNVYVSELASGKHVQILKGHPRTPWCIAFHPSHTQLIGSGCLGGQVRVWALSGGSEVWTVGRETVIASIAFHPRDQLLVIATSNELYFWDWSQPAPFTKVSTNNINEKVRYVAFDSLGYKLITGMTVWNTTALATPFAHALSHSVAPNATNASENTQENRNQESSGSAQEMIVTSYHNLVQRYDNLVRNYRRLFLARHHLINSSTTNTTDRGTDPMETDFSGGAHTSSNDASTSTARSSRNTENDETSGRRRNEGSDGGDSESSSSRLLNLDVLSFDSSNTNVRSEDATQNSSATRQNRPIFGSRRSAFQALGENSDRRFSFMSADRSQRTLPRILPNPFSSTSSTRGTSQRNDSNGNRTGNSRPNIFISQGQEIPPTRYFIQRRGHSTVSQPQVTAPEQATTTSSNQSVPISDPTPDALPASTHTTSRSSENSSSVFGTEFSTGLPNQRPSTVNSSTQISPATNQTINESLDLIRDILRDSGTRLLNLITNMSLSTLASVERSIPRRPSMSHTHTENSDRAQRTRNRQSRIRLFSSRFRNEFLSSGSESDNDPSLEVNIYRTRNSTYPERNPDISDDQLATHLSYRPTDRMIVDLDLDDDTRNNNGNSSSEQNITSNRINIRVSNNRFRVRTHNDNDQNQSNDSSSTRTPQENNDGNNTPQETPLDFRTSRASTSRDNYWMNDPLDLNPDRSSSGSISSEEAYRRVKLGVNALQKHTGVLTNMWLHGTRTSMQELRTMWENLRRRVLSLQRQTGRQDVPSYYTRSIMERCRILTEMSRNISSDLITRVNLNTRQRNLNAETESLERTQENNERMRPQPDRNETSATNEPSTSGMTNEVNSQTHSPKNTARSPRSNAASRRRVRFLVESLRCRSNNELRRRSRVSNTSRWSHRNPNRQGRRESNRAIELHCTRNEIRVRAMQVLSVMFNMMMSCLEERGLSQLIIFMLRTLKKALGLTCLLLMTNRLNRNTENRSTNQNPEASSINLDAPSTSEPQRNNEHTHNITQNSSDVNMEQNEGSNSTSPWPTSETEEENPYRDRRQQTQEQNSATNTTNLTVPGTSNNRPLPMSHKWSNRLAVQISAANRNFSATARHRRELYLEFKRQKALHRCNPHAHPITKKRISPPTATYRIPALRIGPVKNRMTSGLSAPPRRTPAPVIPSPPLNPADGGQSAPDGLGSLVDRAFDSPTVRQRINFFRMAQLHAFRLRNAARNRIRRLQTIQLYTPSSVREMFAWQPPSGENQSENQSSLSGPRELANLIPFTAFRQRFHPTRSGVNESREPQYEFFLNDHPTADAQRGTSSNAPPRIHEYLQPIILAQNALVMEEVGGGGGGAGVASVGGVPIVGAGGHEAAFVSETLGAPTHRVQAWDFTAGCPPDIHDNTKNIVVQRCRIHNDASIDISKDGKLLVALLPVPRLRNMNHRLGVYSLEWGRLGQCLHTASLEQSAVSVALSPTGRHLAVGLGSRRFTTLPHARNNVFALLYKLSPLESSSRTGLLPVRELEHNWEHGFTSLNCLRWAPQPGQGLVYANNTGQLVIMS
ncbi:Activating molecule in BECN1-regulated autophagy protein 1 [Eumeta japonica]|uniref:Activating molecule in BECN1-regulated autophagy protein 1 n=1 Tax=Eumeta variegata TaxID=151549 RepID=A0A4C1XSU6_EUMVA|nr:Activating molecule in BECN1-regulated autophagy protein 1 [Eumeta japonica]